MSESIYSSILEDVKKSDALRDAYDRVYRTDDASIYSGFRNTTDVFNIKTKDTDKYLLPSESFLRVEFQLTNEDEDAIYSSPADAGAEHAGLATLIAGGLHLFERARLIVDGNQIELVNKPGFVHVVDHLLHSTVDKIMEAAESEWLWLDDGGAVTGVYGAGVSGGNAERMNSYAANAGVNADVYESYGFADPREFLANAVNGTGHGGFNPKFNKGFAMRWLRTRSRADTVGKSVELAIPITRLFGFFADIRNAYKAIEFEIELVKNTHYTEIIHGSGAHRMFIDGVIDDGAAAEPAHVLIKTIEWVMPIIVPSTSTIEKLQRELTSGRSSRKTFMSTQVYISERTGTEVDWRIQTTGKRISQVIVGFQHEGQYVAQNDQDYALPVNYTNATDYPNNGGIFSHLTNIQRLELRFGSTVLPRERYIDMEFRENQPYPASLNIARNYADFLQAGGQWLSDTSSHVTYEKYREMYPLFAFDLSKSDIDSERFISQDLRLVAQVTPYTPRSFAPPYVAPVPPATVKYRVIALVTYEYDVDFIGLDGRIAIKLP